MSFKIIVFAVAVFACQANAQIGGIIRPFATGFTNGLTEMAKPFVQFGQTVMRPVSEYIPGSPRPQVSQWMSYPAQIVPQGPYEGYEVVASQVPGSSYFQMVRPNPPFKPQMQYYPSQPGFMKPPPHQRPPRPIPAPTSSSSEESVEVYRPSNLLIQPEEVQEVQVPEVPSSGEADVKVPTLQRPLPIVEDNE